MIIIYNYEGDLNKCFCFQNYITYFLDTLIQKIYVLENDDN